MSDMIFYIMLAAAGLVMIIFYAREKHTARNAFIGMISGGSALILLHFFGERLGYAPPVNLFNTAVSLVLGLPGVALIMAANIFL